MNTNERIRARIQRETAADQPLDTFGRACCWTVIIGSVAAAVLAPMRPGDTWFDRAAFVALVDASWIYVLASDARRRRRAKR